VGKRYGPDLTVYRELHIGAGEAVIRAVARRAAAAGAGAEIEE